MKKSLGLKIMSCFLAVNVMLGTTGNMAQAASIRNADVTEASEGCVLIGVEGTYESVEKSTILKRINEIRKEACVNGYIHPDTGEKLKKSDYVEIKWSSDLEWIAQLRGAEATVYEAHERPNGQRCFSISHDGEKSWAENLAWNHSGLMEGIEQWYDEKEDWIKNTGKVTGHYESLINPEYQYIGLGSFQRATGGWYGIAAEFSFQSELSEEQSSLKGKKIQTIEVLSEKVGEAKLQAPAELKVKNKKQLAVIKKIKFKGIMGGKNVTNGTILDTIEWSSSKKAIAAVDAAGVLKAKKPGKTVIKAKLSDGSIVKGTVKITK